jgi:hypothetical protein
VAGFFVSEDDPGRRASSLARDHSPIGKKMAYRHVLADPAAEALLKAITSSAQKAKPPELLQLAEAYAAVITAEASLTAREAARIAGYVAGDEES